MPAYSDLVCSRGRSCREVRCRSRFEAALADKVGSEFEGGSEAAGGATFELAEEVRGPLPGPRSDPRTFPLRAATTGLFSCHPRTPNPRTMHIPSLEPAGAESSAAVVETALPTSFVCKSGVLLWGQVNTVMQGFGSLKFDSSDPKPAQIGRAGSIVQHAFRFKVGARKGRWRVEAASIAGGSRFGFVCFHEEEDGAEMLRRAARVGVSPHNDHEDSEIVYVNEYDWSWSHGPNVELILQTLGIAEDDEAARMVDGKDFLSLLVATRLMLVDEQGFHALVRSLKNGVTLDTTNYSLRHASAAHFGDASAFGVHLSLGLEDSWERGWMVFSDGLLVGFVYDGANTGLSFGPDTQLVLGNTVVDGIGEYFGDSEDSGEDSDVFSD